MRYPEFKGWDWTEVTDYFDRSKKFDYKKPAENPKETWIEYEERMSEGFTNWLLDHNKNKIAVKVCRLYTKKISETTSSYTGPLWKGLYEIEHDETFIQYFNLLLRGMWT
ncbi:MAG: hypothetical protein ACXAC5_05475 [Promethearchaeota archaeon]|jgi:hypothetical protein